MENNVTRYIRWHMLFCLFSLRLNNLRPHGCRHFCCTRCSAICDALSMLRWVQNSGDDGFLSAALFNGSSPVILAYAKDGEKLSGIEILTSHKIDLHVLFHLKLHPCSSLPTQHTNLQGVFECSPFQWQLSCDTRIRKGW